MDRYTSYHDINHQVMDSSWYDAQPTISPTLDDNAKKTKSSRRGGGKPRTGIACERCRKRKIRCIGNDGLGNTCEACSKAGIDACEYNRVNCVPLVVVEDPAVANLSSCMTNHYISEHGFAQSSGQVSYMQHSYGQDTAYTASGPPTPMTSGPSGDYYSYSTAHHPASASHGSYSYNNHGNDGSWISGPSGADQIQQSVPLVDRRLPTPIRSPLVGSAGALRSDMPSRLHTAHIDHWTMDPYGNTRRPSAMEQLANVSSMMSPISTTSEAPTTLSPHYHQYPTPPYDVSSAEDFSYCSAPTLPPMLTSSSSAYQALPPTSQIDRRSDRSSAHHHQYEQSHYRYGWRPAAQMESE